jgi:multiple sugar transport system permease protein
MRHMTAPPLAARLLIHAVVYLGAATMLAPFAWMVYTSLLTRDQALQPPALWPGAWTSAVLPWNWRWANYADAWQSAALGRFYINSIIVATAVTVLSVLHNALAGFAFAKLRFAGRRPAFALTLATMMLPYQAYFIFAYMLCVRLGYVDNYQALIVPFLASAFGIFYMRQATVTVPDSLLDAGRMDGLGNFELFVHVVVPLIRPGLGALAIFTFMAHWNSFFWPLVVIDSGANYTLPLAVAALSAGTYTDSIPVQMAAATIVTVPVIAVFLVFQRGFVRGIALTGVKG